MVNNISIDTEIDNNNPATNQSQTETAADPTGLLKQLNSQITPAAVTPSTQPVQVSTDPANMTAAIPTPTEAVALSDLPKSAEVGSPSTPLAQNLVGLPTSGSLNQASQTTPTLQPVDPSVIGSMDTNISKPSPAELEKLIAAREKQPESKAIKPETNVIEASVEENEKNDSTQKASVTKLLGIGIAAILIGLVIGGGLALLLGIGK